MKMRSNIQTTLVCSLCFSLVPMASAVEQARLRLGSTPERTRIVFDITGPIEHKLLILENPARIVVEFPRTRLSTPLRDIDLIGTSIKRIKSSEQRGRGLRVVFHIDKGMADNIDTRKIAPSAFATSGGKLVLDLYSPPELDESSGRIASGAGRAGRTITHRSSRQKTHSTSSGSGEGVDKVITLSSESVFEPELSGTWEQEWAGSVDRDDSEKFEALIQPRLDMDLTDDLPLTMIARLRLDASGDLGPDERKPDTYSSINGPWFNSSYAEFSLREFYVDAEWGGNYWRLGKQQVVWGQSDGLKVLDVVNPQSFREFILDEFDDSRIPLWTVNLEVPVGEDSTLQVLWIPDTTYHELAEAGTPWSFTSTGITPSAPAGFNIRIEDLDKPDSMLSDSDFGLRYSTFLDSWDVDFNGWDLTLNYLYHYQDFPVLYQGINLTGPIPEAVLSPGYERNHLAGGTLSNAFGDMTVRAELAYSSDTYQLSTDITQKGIRESADISSVIGFDWQGLESSFVSLQWFQSHLLDYEKDIVRDESENSLSLLYQRDFLNETWQLKALYLRSLTNDDEWMQLKLKYYMQSNLEVWAGADVFNGGANTLFGQFSKNDRINVGLKLGF